MALNDDLEGNSCDLKELISWHLPGEIDKESEQPQS
jgi:hypothetical protein